LAEDIGAVVVNVHLGGIVRIRGNRSFRDPAVKKAMLARVEDALSEIVDGIEGRNVQLAIENVPYPLEETPPFSPMVGIFPSDFSEILMRIGSKRIGATVDFCHLWITHKTLRGFLMSAKTDRDGASTGLRGYSGLTLYEVDEIRSLAQNPFDAFAKRLSDRIVHVHVADTAGSFIPGKSDVTEGDPLGSGDLDLDGFVKALEEIGKHLAAREVRMIVLEVKEKDFNRPLNALTSLIRLEELLRNKGKGVRLGD
jgi:sugar phosphate isomerase/epimerase